MRPASGATAILAYGLAALLGAGLTAHAAHPSREPSPTQRVMEQARTPDGYAYVPGGWSWFGSTTEEERPRERRSSPSFYISRTEVSRAEWKRFRPEYRIPEGTDDYPITAVTREDAMAYCRWTGGHLPSEREWEKAAGGPDGWTFPWGNRFQPERANLKSGRGTQTPQKSVCRLPGSTRGLVKVDDLPQGASPYGALNMAGNVWEWVADNYQDNPRQWIIKGGAAGYGERAAKVHERGIEGAGVT